MTKLSPFLHRFVKSDWGQKCLLLLSPFMLLPEGTTGLQDRVTIFFRQLHANFVAPFLGTIYIAGAMAVLSRVLKTKGLRFLNVIDFDSFQIGLTCSLIICVISYGLIAGQFLAPRLLNFFSKSKRFPCYSFGFWCAHYGGLLMFFGTLVWIPVIFLRVNLTAIVWVALSFTTALALWFLLRLIRKRRRLLVQSVPFPERKHLKIISAILSYGFSLFVLGILFSIMRMYWY